MKTSFKIPYVNIAGGVRALKEEILEAAGRVLDHGQFVLGEEVSLFEQRFAEICGTRFAVAVNSGTDALILALRALEIGPGCEVITVPNSFIATTSAVRMVGARPVFVDVREDYNMDPEGIEKSISSRTKAVLPVHLTGRPADMGPILKISQRHGLKVIEDAAQAILAEYQGQRVGSFGHAGCFSLHPLKTLSACGDGGVLTTNDESLYERAKILRNLGFKSRSECVAWSGNSRLDSLQAAILLVKIKYIQGWTEKRRSHAHLYQRALSGISHLEVPSDRPFEKAVYHTFMILADRRDELKGFLRERGVDTAIHYPIPIHLQEAARELGYGVGSFSTAESQARRVLSLPVYPELTEGELEYVSECIREFYRGPS